MKWLKRLTLVTVFLTVLVGTLALGGWWLSRRPPEWFINRRTGRNTIELAARAERQVARTLDWAAAQQARRDSLTSGARATTDPAGSLDITFSEDELNGFFQKWDESFGWSRSIDRYISDPQIVLRDGHLILAAMVKETGTVMSIDFGPKLEDGKLLMPVDQVLAGRLPLPRGLWNPYRTQLVDTIEKSIPVWQKKAKIRPNGTANSDAVAVSMGELMVDLLDNRPAPAILFLPSDVTSKQKSLPVKLTSVRIENQTLMMTVEPLDPVERDALHDSILTPRLLRTAARSDAPTPNPQ